MGLLTVVAYVQKGTRFEEVSAPGRFDPEPTRRAVWTNRHPRQ